MSKDVNLQDCGDYALDFLGNFLGSMTREEFYALPKDTLWDLVSLLRKSDDEIDQRFSDEVLLNYRDVNGLPLRGGRRVGYWQGQRKLFDDKSIAERQRNYLKRVTLPACRRKMHELLYGRRFQQDLESHNLEMAIQKELLGVKAVIE